MQDSFIGEYIALDSGAFDLGAPYKTNLGVEMLQVKQQSVAELIDKHFDQEHGMHDIIYRFRNSVIVRALEKTNGNVSQAAKILRVHRNNIVRWMKISGISRHMDKQEQA